MIGPRPSSQRRLGPRRVKSAAADGALRTLLSLSPPGPPAFAGARRAALALALAVPAVPAAAQQPDKLQPAPEIIAALPDTLAGAVALKMPNSPMVMYMPRNLGKDPLALVMATRGSKLPEAENMAGQVRESFHESGLREIVREGSFTTPKWPRATTFFGEYVAGTGRKQSWTVIDGEDRINVMVTYYKADDGPRLQAEVAQKIFGGAVVTAGKGKAK